MTFTKYKQLPQAKESEINDFYLLHIIFFLFSISEQYKKGEKTLLFWLGKVRKKKWSLTKPHSFNLRCR